MNKETHTTVHYVYAKETQESIKFLASKEASQSETDTNVKSK